MLKHSIAERLFLEPIKEVFCGAFFGYSIIHEAGGTSGCHEVVFSLDGTWSPFTYELERHGIKIDMGMLDFRIYDHRTQVGSNIEMIISDAKGKDKKPLVVSFDNSASALLIETHRELAIGEIKEYLIDLIREAMAKQ